MLDQRLLHQEHHDMDIYSARKEGIELGIEQGLERGLEQGLERGIEQGIEQGIERGIVQEKRQLVGTMLSKGLAPELVCEIAGISERELEGLLSDDWSLG